MAHDQNEARFSRRDFLEVTSGALAATGATSVTKIAGQDQSTKSHTDRSKSDPGPANPGLVQQTLPHQIENTGDTELKFLEMLKSSFYRDLFLSEWLTHTPPELVMAHFNIDRATLDAIPRDEAVVMPE